MLLCEMILMYVCAHVSVCSMCPAPSTSVLVPLIQRVKIIRILSAAPLRHGALTEWEQSVTDEASDNGPARLHSGMLRHHKCA